LIAKSGDLRYGLVISIMAAFPVVYCLLFRCRIIIIEDETEE